jgi:hypothetical protein
MAFQLTADERVYVQVTHPYSGLFPNSSGSATVAGGDLVPVIDLQVTSDAGLVDSRAKTQGLGKTKGMTGRKSSRWNATFPWQPSGSAGVVPNLDPILQALFSAAPVVSAGVSVTYGFPSSAQPSQLSFYVFRTPGANVFQRAIRGAMVDEFTIASNEEEATISVGGPCAGYIDSVNFAGFDAEDKGGLTAFPAEPGSPTTVGSSVVGFLGSGSSIDGVNTHAIRSWSISGRLGRGLQFAYNNRNATVPTARLREVSFDLELFEENTAPLGALRAKPYTSAAVPIVIKLGVGAGSIATLNMPTAILPAEQLGDSEGQSTVRYSGGRAYISAVGQNDEFSIVLT